MHGLLPWLVESLLGGFQNSGVAYKFLLGSQNFYWHTEMRLPSPLQEAIPGVFRYHCLSRHIASPLRGGATQHVDDESHTGFPIEMRNTLFYLSRCAHSTLSTAGGGAWSIRVHC